MEFFITLFIFIVIVVIVLLAQSKLMSPGPPEYHSESTDSAREMAAEQDSEGLGEEVVDWGSINERLGGKKKAASRKSIKKKRDIKRFQGYREADELPNEDERSIDEFLDSYEGELTDAVEELKKRKKPENQRRKKASNVRFDDYRLRRKNKNNYAEILKKKDGLKQAVVLSEILNRKYD